MTSDTHDPLIQAPVHAKRPPPYPLSEIMDVPETNLKKLRGFVDTHERPKFVPICWHTRKTEICPDLLAHTKDRNLSQFEEMHTSSRKIKVHTSSRKLQIPDPIKLRAEPSN